MKVFFFLLLSSRNIYGLCYYLGPERGVCSCGRCDCKEGYLADNCGQINCTWAAPKCLNPNTVRLEYILFPFPDSAYSNVG